MRNFAMVFYNCFFFIKLSRNYLWNFKTFEKNRMVKLYAEFVLSFVLFFFKKNLNELKVQKLLRELLETLCQDAWSLDRKL